MTPAALFCAALFMHLELGRAARGTYWGGIEGQEWAGIVVAYLIYALSVGAISWTFTVIVRAILPQGRFFSPVVMVTIAAAAILVAMNFGGTMEARSGYSLLEIGLFMGVMVLCVVVYVGIHHVSPESVRNVPMLFLIATLLAAVVTIRIAYANFIDVDARVLACKIVSVIAPASFVIVLAGMWMATRGRRRAPWIRAAMVAILVATSFLLPLNLSGARHPAASGPNLVLITCDALRADYVSAYGGQVETTSLEQLAARGTLFEQSYALAPWTRPSMHGLFASQYPMRMPDSGSQEEWKDALAMEVFRAKEPTLAEQLCARGYVTAAFLANPLLGDANGVTRGFDTVQVWHHGKPVPGGFLVHAPHLRAFIDGLFGKTSRPPDTSRLVTAYVRAFLRRHEQIAGRMPAPQVSQPYFLWLHYMDPHTPLDPPERYRTRTGPWPLFSPDAEYWDTPQIDAFGQVNLSDDEKAYVRSLYEAELRYLDARIGEALSEIGANTYVCLTADHGEEMWDHGKYFHGHTVYDELMRVPLIIAGPGVVAQRIALPVSAIDLMPTLAALVGAESSAEWRGESLAEVLRGATPMPERAVFGQGTNHLAWPLSWRMVRLGDDKLLHTVPDQSLRAFGLNDDPKETQDRSVDAPETVEALKDALDAWSESFPDVLGDEGAPSAEEVEAAREALESMGYL